MQFFDATTILSWKYENAPTAYFSSVQHIQWCHTKTKFLTFHLYNYSGDLTVLQKLPIWLYKSMYACSASCTLSNFGFGLTDCGVIMSGFDVCFVTLLRDWVPDIFLYPHIKEQDIAIINIAPPTITNGTHQRTCMTPEFLSTIAQPAEWYWLGLAESSFSLRFMILLFSQHQLLFM